MIKVLLTNLGSLQARVFAVAASKMENWFGAGLRTSMAVEVEEILHGSRKKGYYNADGKDVRLSVPGVRWADLRQIRRDVLESFKNNCQEAFDKVYQQIMEGRR